MEEKRNSPVWSAQPKRVDRWVKERFASLSRRHVLEAIDLGWVSYHDEAENEHVMKKGDRVPPNNFLDCDKLETHINNTWLGNKEMQIPVVAKRKEWVVIDKPPGVPSAPIGLLDFDTVTHWALAHFDGVAKEFQSEFQPTITPHRLDTGTSGCLIVCLNRHILAEFRKKFEMKTVTKRYLAWCWGKPEDEEFHSEVSIAHHPTDERKMVPVTTGEYREPILQAVTSFKVLKQLSDHFLVEANCQTGVTHQVRVHLARMKFPLLGDELYDPKYAERKLKPPTHLLRATQLSFDGESFSVSAEKFSQSPCES